MGHTVSFGKALEYGNISFRALLKTCCLKISADFRDRKTAIFLSEKKRKTGILPYFEAFCRFYGRKGA